MTHTAPHTLFRKRLSDGEPLAGTFIKTPTSHAIEILGNVGFDFVVIDAEHAPFDRVTIDHMVLATRAAGITAIVRVPNDDHSHLLSVLDCGAAGVLVPHVTSAEMARDLVAACRFRGGKRGFSNTTRAGDYGGVGIWEYVDACDALTTIVAMIEDPEAVEAIDEIVAVDGLDAVFIGRGDLTVAYGAKTPLEPEVTGATEKIIAAANAAGKAVLAMSPGGPDVDYLKQHGVTGIIVGSDQGFMRQAATGVLKALRSDSPVS